MLERAGFTLWDWQCGNVDFENDEQIQEDYFR